MKRIVVKPDGSEEVIGEDGKPEEVDEEPQQYEEIEIDEKNPEYEKYDPDVCIVKGSKWQ